LYYHNNRGQKASLCGSESELAVDLWEKREKYKYGIAKIAQEGYHVERVSGDIEERLNCRCNFFLNKNYMRNIKTISTQGIKRDRRGDIGRIFLESL
jgi:hypothetical protein